MPWPWASSDENRRARSALGILLASQVRQVVEHAPVAAKKTLAQQLVHEIHVTSRDDIRPIFRVPTRNEPSPEGGEKVRKLVGPVGVTGLEPVTSSL